MNDNGFIYNGVSLAEYKGLRIEAFMEIQMAKGHGRMPANTKCTLWNGVQRVPFPNCPNTGSICAVTLRSDKSKKFVPLPKRWVVEQTFEWFESSHRLSREYEYLTRNEEIIIYIALIPLMFRRLV